MDTESKCLRAAARASKATGAPILCHNDEFEPFGRETLDVFDEEKVDFNKVLIGHACGVGDMRYYFDILERGAWLGFDRFGIEAIASPNWNMAHISRNILPALRKAGVSQAIIDNLMVNNPRSYFGPVKPKAARRKA